MSAATSRPLPDASARMAPFWSAAKRGVLVIQRCSTCGRHRFPATELCSSCLSSDVEWVEASGYAELFSFVVVHHALDPYFAARAPYLVADVKLAEGPHMTTTLVDCSPSDAQVGETLEVRFDRASDDFFLPVFRRVSGSQKSTTNDSGSPVAVSVTDKRARS